MLESCSQLESFAWEPCCEQHVVAMTGLYPLTGMESTKAKKDTRQQSTSRPKSPDSNENSNSTEEESYPPENRLVSEISITVETLKDGDSALSLVLRLDDKMNRTLTCKVKEGEKGIELAQELVFYGLINESDTEKIASSIDERLRASQKT